MSRLDPQSWSAPQYPHRPGYKQGSTSREAAHALGARARSLRDAALAVITASDGLTADEVARVLGESVLAIRPRITELARMNRIHDCGIRRANASGRSAIVWRINV